MGFDVYGRLGTVDINTVTYAQIRARGDGNCLFHAAGHGLIILAKIGADDFDHASFRAHVVDYVADHAKDTSDLGLKLRDGLGITGNQRDVVSVRQGQQIDRSVAYLRRLRSWGDEACITAIEQLYTVEVEVYDTTGGDNALGVPYYVTFADQTTKLRLCICMRGHIPWHYNLYIPNADYDGTRDDTGAPLVEKKKSSGSLSSAPPSKAKWIKQSAKERWAYHLNPKGLELFGPVIGPRQFHFSRAIIDKSEEEEVPVKRSLSVSLGNQINSVSVTAPVLAVVLRNSSEDDETQLFSRSWTAASDALEDALKEPLQLPLARVSDGVATALHVPDLAHTQLIIDTARGKEDQPGTLYLRIYRRSKGLLATKQSISGDGLVAECELPLGKVEAEELDEPDRSRYTFDLSKGLPKHLIRLLTSEASPYQLVAASTAEFTRARCAWTHFHVPSDWDINIAETFATVPVVMLSDSPAVLSELGVKAEVEPLAKSGVESFAMPTEQSDALTQVLAAAGLGRIDANACNYLVEVGDDEWYLATSWASMASLEKGKDGRYYLSALYWSSGRRAYRVSAEELEAPGSRREATAGLVDVINVVRPACMTLRGHDSALTKSAKGIVELDQDNREFLTSLSGVPNSSHKTKLLRSNDETYRRSRAELLRDCRTRYNACRGAIQTMLAGLHDHQDTLMINALWGYSFALSQRELLSWSDLAPTGRAQTIEGFSKEIDCLYRDLLTKRDAIAQKGLALDFEQVEGVKDFETSLGKHLSPGLDWKRHVFDPPVLLAHAVTAGISSCAGGVTFTTQKKSPNHVFMWHIDAQLSMPMLCEYERLWPKGKGAPAMRSLALVNPSTWEINKYRPDNIYPATVVDTCETILFARSDHWYVDQPTVAGCDLFGVDVREVDTVDWVFTYDIDKRISGLMQWTSLEGDSEDLPVVRAHFLADLYGAYRYDDAKIASDKAMLDYIGVIAGGSTQVAVRKHKRANANRSCRVPALSVDVFDTIAASAQPLLTTECVYAGERGDWELSHLVSDRWTPGTTS